MQRFTFFEDLVKLDDTELEILIKDITTTDLLYCLKGASEKLSFKFFSVMSKNVSSYIESELDDLEEISLSDIKAAQKRIIDLANDIFINDKIKIAIASDHAAYELKEYLKEILTDYDIIDFGTDSLKSVDYPDIGFKATEAVAKGVCDKAVIMCGSGIGMSIVANKVKGIRAALCHCSDFVKLSRQHNDANVLILPGRFISKYLAKELVKIFLTTKFEGGRHQNRINKILKYEEDK